MMEPDMDADQFCNWLLEHNPSLVLRCLIFYWLLEACEWGSGLFRLIPPHIKAKTSAPTHRLPSHLCGLDVGWWEQRVRSMHLDSDLILNYTGAQALLAPARNGGIGMGD